MIKRSLLAGVVAFAFVTTVTVRAAEIGTIEAIEISWGDGQTWVANEDNIGDLTRMPDGSVHLLGGYATSEWAADWDLALGGIDGALGGSEGITSNVAVQSLVDFTETFELTLWVKSVVDIAAPSLLNGSVSTNVGDNVQEGNPGATVAAVDGGAAYQALINDMVVGEMLADPFSLTAPAGETASFGPEFFADAGGPALGVGDEIAIRHEFTLTAFDVAQFTGTLSIVPEPATAALLALGGCCALRRRR